MRRRAALERASEAHTKDMLMLFSESIVYRLVSPSRIFKDVPQRLVRDFKDIVPGTMAMLTLQPAGGRSRN